jgi:hypothetical protein
VTDTGMLDVKKTALLAGAAADIDAARSALVSTQSTLSSTSLPADAFGRLPESAGAAEQHSKHVKEAQWGLDQARKDLGHLITHLQSRKVQYDQAIRNAVDRLLDIGSTRKPMSFPQPPMTPVPDPFTPPMTPRSPN